MVFTVGLFLFGYCLGSLHFIVGSLVPPMAHTFLSVVSLQVEEEFTPLEPLEESEEEQVSDLWFLRVVAEYGRMLNFYSIPSYTMCTGTI